MYPPTQRTPKKDSGSYHGPLREINRDVSRKQRVRRWVILDVTVLGVLPPLTMLLVMVRWVLCAVRVVRTRLIRL